MPCQREATLGHECASIATISTDVSHGNTDDLIFVNMTLQARRNERSHLIIDPLRPFRSVRFVELLTLQRVETTRIQLLSILLENQLVDRPGTIPLVVHFPHVSLLFRRETQLTQAIQRVHIDFSRLFT